MNKFKNINDSIFGEWCSFFRESRKLDTVEQVDWLVHREIELELFYIHELRKFIIADE